MKMKLCIECGAASKDTSNFCHRCKTDIHAVKPEKTIYVLFVKDQIVGDIYFTDLDKLKKYLDKFMDEVDDYKKYNIAHCFYSQIIGDKVFEPIEVFEVRWFGISQFFMPTLKVAPKKPSTKDGSFSWKAIKCNLKTYIMI